MAFSIPLELQSGFMGYHPVNPDLKLSGSAPLTVAGVVNGVLKGNHAAKTPSKKIFSAYVDGLFREYHSNSDSIKDFDFREKILIAGKYYLADANGSFYSWINDQLKSDKLTAMHKEFLIDTLRFIKTGTRKVSIESWYRIIDPRPIGINDKLPAFTPSLYVNNCSYESTNYHYDKLPMKISNVLAEWTSHRHGFIDLIYSLAVIYGEYTS